jgi:hypothetical protein
MVDEVPKHFEGLGSQDDLFIPAPELLVDGIEAKRRKHAVLFCLHYFQYRQRSAGTYKEIIRKFKDRFDLHSYVSRETISRRGKPWPNAGRTLVLVIVNSAAMKLD